MGFDWKKGSTEQQRKAIEYVESPLLIVAGPGTGKTRVLTEKVIYLVKEKGFDPNRILVSTFTVKASEELKERLRESLGDDVENMQISTIHSFCEKMLQSFPEYHNFGNIFSVLDELDQFIFVNKNYWNYGLREYASEINVDELIIFYNKCTENDVNPKELVEYCKNNHCSARDIAIARSYELYLGNLLNPNDTRLDFSLLQREFYHLLLENPEVLQMVQGMYDYILIDEYQDTNPIQDAIFKLIAEPLFNITVVGDEDQSIYGFRGASIRNFRTFLQRYPGAKKLELEENFRSCREIVECFDAFMKPHRTFEKKIFTNNSCFSSPVLICSESKFEEAEAVVSFIKKLHFECNVRYEDIAILFKSVKFHSVEIVDELEKCNIPYIVKGDRSLLAQDEIRDFLVLMLFVNNYEPTDYQSKWLFRHDILSSDFLGLEEETIEKLEDAVDVHCFLDSYDYDKLQRLGIAEGDIQRLVNLRNLRKQQSANKLGQLQLFYKILDATEYHYRLFRRMEQKGDGNAEIVIRNLATFSNLIYKFEQNTYSKEFKTFLYHICSIPENKMEDSASYEDVDAVRLMTIHQAKGLEFPVVILGGVTNRRYTRDQQEDEFIIEIPVELMLDKNHFDRGEEIQRAFYVGFSRGKKLVAVSTIDGRGSKPSIFIEEIGCDMFIGPEEFDKKLSDEDHYIPIKEPTKLSYSSVSAYIDCPFRFYMRDYLGFQTPMDYFQTYGVIVHNSLKKLHVLMKEGEEVGIQDVISIVDMYCKDDDSRKKWRDELITDIWQYYEKTPSFIKEIVDVELPFSYIDADIVVNGQVDLVIRNMDGELEIIDYKSRYKEGLGRMNVDIQLRLYNIALKKRYDEEIKNISAYTFKDNTRTVFDNSEEELGRTKNLVGSISRCINDKQFGRNWHGPFCESKAGKCEFYYLCNQLEGEK